MIVTETPIDRWKNLVTCSLCADETCYQRFLERIEQGFISRDENPLSHFCTLFQPFDPQTKKVFIVHHKKSNLWIAPGGHLDFGETPDQTVNREIMEELGVRDFFKKPPEPILFSILDINRPQQTCQAHFDAWYLMETDGSDFHIDPSEFHETRWVTIPEARSLVVDRSTLLALERIETINL